MRTLKSVRADGVDLWSLNPDNDRSGGGPVAMIRALVHCGHHAVRVVVVAMVAAALAACGSGTTAGPAPATSQFATPGPTSTAPTSPADVAGQQAIAAYLGMWQDFTEAATTSDWRSSKLARNATGEALSRGLYADHYNGLTSRGRPVNNPQVSSVDPVESPTKVVISDCGDSTNWVKYRVDNGQPANDGPGGRRQINAIVKKAVDGSWKVTDFGVQAVGTC